MLPRYWPLHSRQIQEKEPGDCVKAADRASDGMLNKGLSALLSGSRVVGEERIPANAGLLDDLDDELPIWVDRPAGRSDQFCQRRKGLCHTPGVR